MRSKLFLTLTLPLIFMMSSPAGAIVYTQGFDAASNLAAPFNQTAALFVGYGSDYYGSSITLLNEHWGLATIHQIDPEPNELRIYTGQDIYGGYDQMVIADAWFRNPDPNTDTALVYFETSITGIDFAPLATEADVFDGMEITLVGYGESGPMNGPFDGSFGYRLAGEDSADVGKPLIGIGDEFLVSQLDGNGDAGAYFADSGGTAYTLNATGDWVVAGMITGGRGNFGHEGSLSVYANLTHSVNTGWMHNTMTEIPEPGTFILLTSGALALLPLRRRRKSSSA